MKFQIEKDLKDARAAAKNVIDDLQIERENLVQAKAKDDAMLASIGDGMVAINEQWRVITMSEVTEGMLGWKFDEIKGKDFYEIAPIVDEKGEKVPRAKRPLHIALATGKKITTTTTTTTTTTGPSYSYIRKDGTRFPVAITTTPIVVEDRIIGAINVFRDITWEKEIDQAKSEFISLASHQLKTPPTVIKLLTERLLGVNMGELSAKQQEYLKDIRSTNQRMIDLVNALLSISRIEMGAFAIEAREKDARAIVQSVFDELKLDINKKQLKSKIVLPKNSVNIMLDESLFSMTVNNLITNAIHYTAKGGKILVECKKVDQGRTIGGKSLENDYFVVVVADTGCGIPQDEQDKVFTKFFRADNAREKRANGTGLGLYITKSILDHSGGLIWFTSRENKGSVFYIAIPMTGMKSVDSKEEPVFGQN